MPISPAAALVPLRKLTFIHIFELDISIKYSVVRPGQYVSPEQHALPDELEQAHPPGVSNLRWTAVGRHASLSRTKGREVIHIWRFQRHYPEGIKCE